ncbi:hypothetical protein QEG73_00970 [Chitinophagaceae bacterium 26-R-25]|nr:hypothetical protein [Chitinophagaceae bacterium 26-R-25]
MLTQLILNLFLVVNTIYNYNIPSASGGEIKFSDFSGKKVLIVNVASQSKYSQQLQRLDSLQIQYLDSLVVVVIPSNSFGHEPMDSIQVQTAFNGYHFKVAAKSSITGAGQSVLYNWLTNEAENERFSSQVKDDFQKYLIDGTGNLIGIFVSSVDPLSKELTSNLKTN